MNDYARNIGSLAASMGERDFTILVDATYDATVGNLPSTRPFGKREADRPVDAHPSIITANPLDAFYYLNISWGYVPASHVRPTVSLTKPVSLVKRVTPNVDTLIRSGL